jgi:hypothetical protein
MARSISYGHYIRADWGRRALIVYRPTYMGKEMFEWFKTIGTEPLGGHEHDQNLSISSSRAGILRKTLIPP